MNESIDIPRSPQVSPSGSFTLLDCPSDDHHERERPTGARGRSSSIRSALNSSSSSLSPKSYSKEILTALKIGAHGVDVTAVPQRSSLKPEHYQLPFGLLPNSYCRVHPKRPPSSSEPNGKAYFAPSTSRNKLPAKEMSSTQDEDREAVSLRKRIGKTKTKTRANSYSLSGSHIGDTLSVSMSSGFTLPSSSIPRSRSSKRARSAQDNATQFSPACRSFQDSDVTMTEVQATANSSSTRILDSRTESLVAQSSVQLANEAESECSSLTPLSSSRSASVPIHNRGPPPDLIHHFQPQSDTEFASGFAIHSLVSHDLTPPPPCSPSPNLRYTLPLMSPRLSGSSVNELSLRLPEYSEYSTPPQSVSPQVHNANTSMDTIPESAQSIVTSHRNDPASCYYSPSARSLTLASNSESSSEPSFHYLPSPVSPITPFRPPPPARSTSRSSSIGNTPCNSRLDVTESASADKSYLPSSDVLEHLNQTNHDQVRPSLQNPFPSPSSISTHHSHHTSLEPEIHAEPVRIKTETEELQLQTLASASVPSETGEPNDSNNLNFPVRRLNTSIIDVFPGALFESDEFELGYPDD